MVEGEAESVMVGAGGVSVVAVGAGGGGGCGTTDFFLHPLAAVNRLARSNVMAAATGKDLRMGASFKKADDIQIMVSRNVHCLDPLQANHSVPKYAVRHRPDLVQANRSLTNCAMRHARNCCGGNAIRRSSTGKRYYSIRSLLAKRNRII